MGSRRREVVWLLLLLMLFLLENQCCADGSSRFIQGNKKSLSSSSTLNPARIDPNYYKGVVADKDDEVFGAEKRRVYTGPNPLHNR
ncbi:CLAVATA3/ESR-RELATED 17 [Salvia divinorum]|uniref:CLAVATA3/ESR-RELATED 17 n=1 Tax=Salvia divinorum TaxID=28513 RepID=A0ABD1H0P6_SALDI